MVIFPISIFSQIRSEGGGVIKYHFFPKFKIVQIILGGRGGGVMKIMDFFHNLGHFLFGMLPLEKFLSGANLSSVHVQLMPLNN